MFVGNGLLTEAELAALSGTGLSGREREGLPELVAAVFHWLRRDRYEVVSPIRTGWRRI